MIRSPWRSLQTSIARVIQPSLSQRSRKATTASAARPTDVARNTPTSSRGYDDQLLGEIFDSEPLWHQFSQTNHGSPSKPWSGLFQNSYLTKASGFRDFTQTTLKKCQGIVAGVLAASSLEQLKSIPKDLDRLSDALCRVLDIAEFVRTTHPNPSFQQAANEAYLELFEYMNVLNTTTGIDSQLKRAVANAEISRSWGEEEKTVARTLLKDFSKSAIHLPRNQRDKFVSLSNEISQLGTAFVREMAAAKPFIALDSYRLKEMDPLILQQVTNTGGKTLLPSTGPFSTTALQTVHDDSARREIYIAGRMASDNQVRILERFLQLRAEVASLSGYSSYAEMILSDKMASSPEAVKSFLTGLSAANAIHIQKELNEMETMKRRSNAAGGSTEIFPWDREYYRARSVAQRRPKSRKPDFISAYFSLGRVMQGLSRLFGHLYGVRFCPSKVLPGETWNPNVRRLDVIDEKEGRIAVVYCDLFARQGKSPNPAHFTLRCSRRISPVEIEEATSLSDKMDPFLAANDGMAISRSPEGVVYQLPVIALICNFEQTEPRSVKPTLLSFRDVNTLFHEMGHAIHSILGRTDLHVVSGTRCATDFAELPSVLMEHFAQEPSVLALFASHWETNAALPREMITERLALDRKWQGADTETQILLAMLDQAYHSDPPLRTQQEGGGGFDTTRIFHDVYDRYGSVREPRETTAQGFFGHLVEYGGTYYSYLFDRAIAGKVWSEVFRGGKDGGATSRAAGQRMRDEVLKWGGGRDGWRCVAGVLGDDRLKNGGPEAMAEVGKWGVKD